MKLKIIALFVAVFASQAALANGQVVPAIENIPVADQDIPPGYVDMFVGGEEKPKIGKPAKDGANISYKHAENRDAMPARGDEGRVVYTFGESDPTVVCTPLRVCDIELEAGEVIVGEPQIGDGVRWKVSPAVHGSGASKTTHVIVKPTARNIETNLIIPTDRRVYHLRLAAVDDSARFTRYISFYYPDSAAKAWASYQSQVQKEETPVIDRPSVSVDQLDFAYSIEVDSGDGRFKPVRVFNDGQKTFIQLPSFMSADEAPAFFVIGTDGKEQLVNYRIRDGYYVIDKVFANGALVAGVGDEQERITIARNGKSSFRAESTLPAFLSGF